MLSSSDKNRSDLNDDYMSNDIDDSNNITRSRN